MISDIDRASGDLTNPEPTLLHLGVAVKARRGEAPALAAPPSGPVARRRKLWRDRQSAHPARGRVVDPVDCISWMGEYMAKGVDILDGESCQACGAALRVVDRY